jgi:hypothetical protein
MRLLPFIFLIALFVPAACFGQEIAPITTLRAFHKKFPAALTVIWNHQGDGIYEANFVLGNQNITTFFDDDGEWLETSTAIGQQALPPDVLSGLHHSFSGSTILGADYFQSPEIASAYAVELVQAPGFAILEVLISPYGKVLQQTARKLEDVGMK